MVWGSSRFVWRTWKISGKKIQMDPQFVHKTYIWASSTYFSAFWWIYMQQFVSNSFKKSLILPDLKSSATWIFLLGEGKCTWSKYWAGRVPCVPLKIYTCAKQPFFMVIHSQSCRVQVSVHILHQSLLVVLTNFNNMNEGISCISSQWIRACLLLMRREGWCKKGKACRLRGGAKKLI